ncbi:hypothetical protein IV203_023834 [Nitzschia inconspicua]|uniref:Uncharacterized protein n=1 Tax=Nitzschia inconspicua TaxID=303405 RepID=A0A9K3KBU7_9STRA|nr:hypothetical protein IV203_023834 [Nitzschia inconspicua]
MSQDGRIDFLRRSQKILSRCYLRNHGQTVYPISRDWTPDTTVYTSCHLAQYIGSSKGSYHSEFLRLFPFVEHTLGTGTPGDIFESDFRLHLEQCHNLRDAQVAIMGPDKAEDVMVVLGKLCDGDESKLLCPAGKINILPDPPEDPVALQRTTLRAANVMKVAQWFIPESKTQPFLDFMQVAFDGDSKFSWENTLCRYKPAEENRRWASDGWLRSRRNNHYCLCH